MVPIGGCLVNTTQCAVNLRSQGELWPVGGAAVSGYRPGAARSSWLH